MKSSQKRIRWDEAVVPGIALLFVLAFFLQTRDAPKVAVYWPVITAVGGGLLWVAVLLKHVLSKREASSGSPAQAGGARRADGRPAMILIGSLVYILAASLSSFTVCSFAFMLLMFRGLGSRQWTRNVLVAAGIALFLHLALITFMKLNLPQLNLGSFSI